MPNQKVLIVDDTTQNIQFLVHILQADYNCSVAKSGEEALALAAEIMPDIILLDILMPDMSGYEVLTALKSEDSTKHIPVICVTGLSDQENEEKGLALGATDYINRANSEGVIKLRVQRQLQLIKALHDAEDAAHAKSDFLAKMSHEIRTPMHSIIGITDIQLQKQHPTETENALLQIRASSDILLSLINDALDLSQVEEGKMVLYPKRYDMASLITSVIQQNLWHDKKHIVFKPQVCEMLPLSLIGDEFRIKQVLNNLLSNAFKYTDKGEVTFTIKSDGDMLAITVADTGHGMAQEQVDALFGKYLRFSEQSHRHIQGTGLGLNISRQLVLLMGGEITCKSTPGKGSTFFVRIPQHSANPLTIGLETAEKLQNFQFSREHYKKTRLFEYEPMPYGKVLVVDDLESNLVVARGLLEPYSIEVHTAMSGQEAIKLLDADQIYDIIFLDHMMPGMSGPETARAMRTLGYKKPIIALTANVSAWQPSMAINEDFNGFVAKPIDINLLHDCLTQYIKDIRETTPKKKHSVSNTVYAAFLRDATRVRNSLDELIQKPELSNTDIERFTIHTHGIKNGLATVGLVELAKIAGRLEIAGRNAEWPTIHKETIPFIQELDKIINEVKE